MATIFRIVLCAAPLTLYFTLLNFFSARSLLPRHDASDIMVSLTSYPRRIGGVYLAIESLFHQSVLPQRILLWLAAEEFPNQRLPRSLQRLEKRGLEVCFYPQNLRSYLKLYPARLQYPEHTIVTADDDCFYPYGWLERLLAARERFPDTVLCYRAHMMQLDAQQKLETYMKIKGRERVCAPAALHALLPTGVSGVLYPPHVFHDDFYDSALFMRLCPTADDLWFKVMAMKRGVKSVRIGQRNYHPNMVVRWPHTSLKQANIGQGKNDLYLTRLFAHYPEIMDMLEAV